MIELGAVCDLAAGLPGAEEGTWYGAPAFRVSSKVFARGHENDPDLFLIKVGPEERDFSVATQPERFSRTDHRPEREDSVLMRLSANRPEDLEEVRHLVETALHRFENPKRR
ncbi:MAG TPA: MmcQ/YjbR family DNA-binding protein [Acidimicrobiales bacterium]|nr:MmcQ/YjbR family DNA-binding protein [Acidimicrobiales bacterium]